MFSNNAYRKKYEEKLDEEWVSPEIVIKLLFNAFIKKYWWYDVFNEDIHDLMDDATHENLDCKPLLCLPHLFTRKRREAILLFYSKWKWYWYSDITSFIFAIDRVEKSIKKTCNCK